MKMQFDKAGRAGIALVITLIMLAVTLVMAVTFLAISSRERGAVSTTTDAAHARLATDSALAHAEAQIMASILATTNPYNFGLLVSTNYINSYGFVTANGSNPTNVSYYDTQGNFLGPADLAQNIANLQYLPRAPVFVPTNNAGGYDFRFYLDLNRNGQFDANNNVSNVIYYPATKTTTIVGNTTAEVGDPEWIGVLEHPDAPHGPLNHFIARYAFIAVPVGNTLDVNAIYNDALEPNNNMTEDGFLRNEGVGSWELNLAAFLADLNTNEWDSSAYGSYDYQAPGLFYVPPLAFNGNQGAAFQDAESLLSYRYNTNLLNQLSVNQLTANPPPYSIDYYSRGPLLTTNFLPAPVYNGWYREPWSGADNTNHFFTPSDFFNKAKTQGNLSPNYTGFTDRLLQAGTNTYGNGLVPTYDRYTYYRLLSQLGTDTTPDYGKLNINYVNVNTNEGGGVVPGMETNYYTWTAQNFFTNAADRLLKAYTTNWYGVNYVYGSGGSNNTIYNYYFTNTFGNYTSNGVVVGIGPFGITNIPVWVNGRFVYTPSVQRLLQLAANIYDATTNSFYPSVFRPTFYRDPLTGNVFINGYQYIPGNIDGVKDYRLASPVDVKLLASGSLPATGSGTTLALNNVNVYGVPWIIGAKKGLPSFNELNVMNTVQVTRLLQVNRSSTNPAAAIYTTNQMYVMSITNSVGMSFWNSYNSNYYNAYNNIEVSMQETMLISLSNANYQGTTISNFNYYANLGQWSGSEWTYAPQSNPAPVPWSFLFTNWSAAFLPASAYQPSSGTFIPVSQNPLWDTSGKYYAFPQFLYMTTNWSQAFILDGPPGSEHVVDYVQLNGPNNTRNLTAELADPDYKGPPQFTYQWSTNGYGRNNTTPFPAYGEANQILVSRGTLGPPPGGVWATTAGFQGNDRSPAAQQAFFTGFWTPNFSYNGVTYANTEYSVQAPYTPTRTMYDYTLWQANDPLVHYLASDLDYADTNTTGVHKNDSVPPVLNTPGQNFQNLNQLGKRYQPWGMAGQLAGIAGVDTNIYNLAYKDPLVWRSDFWNFPTNKFPSVGWLGRVHRGTPWQTVYLKSSDLLTQSQVVGNANQYFGTNTWLIWSGNANNVFDAVNTAPRSDRLLFDLFTTEPNENATLGKLPINQTRLAAWSALFSGLMVYNTNAASPGSNTIIQPAGVYYTNYIPGNPNTYLGDLWFSIQATRASTNLFPNQSFGHVGDLLAAPALTVQSPFLPWNTAQANFTLNDEEYEWLPQQVMSLVTLGTPRYLVYCYGQALKPAPGGLVTGGAYAGMCTNYQIVSESATRAVLQVQNPNSPTPSVILKNLNPLPPDQ